MRRGQLSLRCVRVTDDSLQLQVHFSFSRVAVGHLTP